MVRLPTGGSNHADVTSTDGGANQSTPPGREVISDSWSCNTAEVTITGHGTVDKGRADHGLWPRTGWPAWCQSWVYGASAGVVDVGGGGGGDGWIWS